MLCILPCRADTGPKKGKSKARFAAYANYVCHHYPLQLTNPQKHNRKCFSQFGYNLYYIPFPIFPITKFISPHNFGIQSYGQPGKGEKNGSLYTCRGGFMDFSHIRAAIDWTVYLTFKMVTEKKDFDLPNEGGRLKLQFKNINKLSLDEIASIAERITFERLIWHEVASWHYHLPNYAVSQQSSAFTPEDSYSDLLGAVIGKKVALRILKNEENLSYGQIAADEIRKAITLLGPVDSKKESRHAYDIVDRYKQLQLPADKRNYDVWWDSQIIFADQRYVFKRYLNAGPALSPWLVPESETLGCTVNPKPATIYLPQKTKAGEPLTDFYQFTIYSDSALFFNKRTGRQLHPPFGPFVTTHLDKIVDIIRAEMEKVLLPGFDQRDCQDPVPEYKNAVVVMFK